MPNRMYVKGREKFLRGEIAWHTDPIKAVLIDSADYTPDTTNHEFLSAIPAAGRVATSPNLGGKTTTNGTADADDITFPNVSGDSIELIAIYKDTGDPATSPLIVLMDTVTGLPVQPNTGPIAITWSNAADRIFTL